MEIAKELKRIALTVKLPLVMKFNDYHGIEETAKLLNIFGKVNYKELNSINGVYLGLFWEGQEPKEEDIQVLMTKAGIRLPKKQVTKDMAYNRWKGSKQIEFSQQAWGDASKKELVTPAGFTPEEYAKGLRALFHGSYPQFSVVNGKVIEEDFNSIGD